MYPYKKQKHTLIAVFTFDQTTERMVHVRDEICSN